MSAKFKVAVVGAGIMGRTLGWMLTQRGYHVTLFEAESLLNPLSSSAAAAGMICPFTEAEQTIPEIVSLGQRSLQLWPEIISAMPDQPFSNFPGTLILAHHQDENLTADFFRRMEASLPPDCDGILRRVDPKVVGKILGIDSHSFSQGWIVNFEGNVDSRDLLLALLQGIALKGEVREWTPVSDISQGRIHTTQYGFEEFQHVFDCRGLGARNDLTSLRGVRGEIIRLHAPQVTVPNMVRLLHPRHPLYLVPRANHRFMIGATSIESEDKSPITVRSALEMLSALFSLNPSFAEARVEECTTHLRPALPDNLPLVIHDYRITRINGLFRHGYLIAPALTEKVISEVF